MRNKFSGASARDGVLAWHLMAWRQRCSPCKRLIVRPVKGSLASRSGRERLVSQIFRTHSRPCAFIVKQFRVLSIRMLERRRFVQLPISEWRIPIGDLRLHQNVCGGSTRVAGVGMPSILRWPRRFWRLSKGATADAYRATSRRPFLDSIASTAVAGLGAA